MALATGALQPKPLLPVQQSCGISATLAHIASLCTTTKPPYPVEDENAFARLQLVFHEASGKPGPHKLYKLSPLLAPPPPLPPPPPSQSIGNEKKAGSGSVDNCALAEAAAAKASQRAKKAESELLSLLAREQAQREAKEAAKKRRHVATSQPDLMRTRINHAVAHSGADDTSGSRGTSSGDVSDVTLEELTAARGTLLDEAAFVADEWVEIRSSRGRKPTPTQQPTQQPKTGEQTTTPTSTFVSRSGQQSNSKRPGAPTVSIEPAHALPDKGSPTCPANAVEDTPGEGFEQLTWLRNEPAAEQEEEVMTEVVAHPEVKVESNAKARAEEGTAGARRGGRAKDSAEEARLREQVAALTEQVASLRAALDAKDAAHMRELTAAQEREGTRLQALQLRLYIANSRVTSLEDALSKHVAAVGLPMPGAPAAPISIAAAADEGKEQPYRQEAEEADEDEQAGDKLAKQQLERRRQRGASASST